MSSDSSSSASESSSSGTSSSGSSSGDHGPILVTGGTGFIAAHIIQQLLQAGHNVRATCRDASNKEKTKPLRKLCDEAKTDALEIVSADLLDAESWPSAVEGCSLVVHVASPFPDTTPKDEMELIRPARDGTLNVLRACRDDGDVQRVVITSSIAAITAGYKTNHPSDRPAYDETDWSDINSKTIDPYSKSKTLAEKAAWEFVEGLDNDEKFELVVMNPGFVIGPIVHGRSCTSAIVVRKLMNREAAAVPDLHWQCVDVRDVAAAHIKAVFAPAKQVNGERFVLTTGLKSMREMATALSSEFNGQGYKPPTKQVPYCIMWCLGRKDPNIKAILPRIGRKQIMTSAKAQKTLKLKFRPIDNAVVDMAYSLVEAGIVDRTDGYKGPKGK